VGTLQYMAPEQLEGKQADTRSDIFALGCVLYEMISGRPPFYGKSTASVVAAIMEREPATLQHNQAQLPTALTRLVAKCLAKDPDSRWQCAADLRDAVSWIAASEISAVSQGNAKPRRQWLPWAIASGMALVAAGASVLSFMGRSQDRHTMRFIVPAPPGYIISSWSAGGGAFISPDGRMLVFRAEGPSDPPLSGKLWLRRLELEAATPLEGTEGAAFPFWSPDSKYVGYFLGTKLMKVQVDSGQMQPICDAPFGRGGTWSTRNDIVFVSADGSLSRVSDAGGPAQVMMTGNSSERNASPAFLPDGRNFLFVRLTGDTEPVIFASSLDKSTTPVRLTEGSAPLFASGSSGGRDHIIFGQGSAYVAQEFDTRALRVRGPQIPLVRQPFPFASTAFYSTSRNGALAFPSGEGATKRRLMIYARHGPVVNKIGPDGNYRQPRFSPAGDRIAVEKSPAPDVLPDIWVIDVHSGATTRITTAPNWEYAPVWSADGSRIFFSASQRGRSDLMSGLSVGGGDVRLALKNPGYLMTLFPTDTSRDGRFIVFDSNKDILAVPLPSTDQALVTKPIPLVNTSFEEMHAALSPNGRWLAYTSNETGRHEVYVRVFQPSSGGNPTGIWPVSTDGGAQPRWRGDGKELFYVSMNGEVRATSIETGSELRIGTTTKLFDSGLEAGAMLQSAYRYDVTRDGQRFILSRLVGDAQSPVINVVLNWQASVTSQPSAGQ
jgi:Tol biopolymer transport system component